MRTPAGVSAVPQPGRVGSRVLRWAGRSAGLERLDVGVHAGVLGLCLATLWPPRVNKAVDPVGILRWADAEAAETSPTNRTLLDGTILAEFDDDRIWSVGRPHR
jgi:hypothetical protein